MKVIIKTDFWVAVFFALYAAASALVWLAVAAVFVSALVRMIFKLS